MSVAVNGRNLEAEVLVERISEKDEKGKRDVNARVISEDYDFHIIEGHFYKKYGIKDSGVYFHFAPYNRSGKYVKIVINSKREDLDFEKMNNI